MSGSEVGKIGWIDLTVDNAEKVKDFYAAVVGWEVSEFPVADYHDYCVSPSGGDAVAGICHKQGVNAEIPSQWLMYVTVANLEQSIEQCKANGGDVLTEPRDMGGYGVMSVIRDPAGAVCAIIESAKSA